MSGQSLEQRLLRAWYGQARWLTLLRPLSWLYRRIVVRRRQQYLSGERTQWQPPVPLIVVGNITLGGTGKTPMVIWLVEFLQSQGWRVGVISRGYGATPPSLPWLVTPDDSAAVAGDEPLLIVQRCKVPLVIDPDRPAAAQRLLSEGVDLIISDDGLQHYALGRSVELVLLDQQRDLGNRRCLPEGPLREPAERLQSVDLIVRNGASADGAKGYAMQLAPGVLVNLVSGERLAATRWSGPRQVSAMAGIGNPERFFSTLEALAFECETYVFADHARYDEQMLAALPANRPVLMTEKDAVKCTGLARGNWWYLSVDAQLSEDFAAALLTLLPAAPQKGREPIQE